MTTNDIPTSVTVAGTRYDATYTSTKDKQSATWTWYPPTEHKESWPHVTVGYDDDVKDTIQITDFQGNTAPLTKDWWFKLHVSVPLGGTNVHMFYKINTQWAVSGCGNNLKHVPSHKKSDAQWHVNRQATDYRAFAQAFVSAARKGYIDDIVKKGAPKTTRVGPQTSASWNDSTGL